MSNQIQSLSYGTAGDPASAREILSDDQLEEVAA